MPKINIYVSDELKKKMDKAQEKINWSGVASAAFESVLSDASSNSNLIRLISNDQLIEEVRKRMKGFA